MNTPFSQPMTASDRQLNAEEMDQILDAILSGKYSWACALMLRYTGHEPLRYLPQRTYTRLMRENVYAPKNPQNARLRSSVPSPRDRQSTDLLYDLDHTDIASPEAMQSQGGDNRGFIPRNGDVQAALTSLFASRIDANSLVLVDLNLMRNMTTMTKHQHIKLSQYG